MRFMLFIKANPDSEAGVMPPKEVFEAMGKFNDELVKAGVLLAAEGLHPSSKGSRVKFVGGKPPIVTDGPFAETKELVAGFWMIDVKSREEALAWAKRCPAPTQPGEEGAEIEIRQVYELSDFPAEVLPAEEVERELRQRAAAPPL